MQFIVELCSLVCSLCLKPNIKRYFTITITKFENYILSYFIAVHICTKSKNQINRYSFHSKQHYFQNKLQFFSRVSSPLQYLLLDPEMVVECTLFLDQHLSNILQVSKDNTHVLTLYIYALQVNWPSKVIYHILLVKVIQCFKNVSWVWACKIAWLGHMIYPSYNCKLKLFH